MNMYIEELIDRQINDRVKRRNSFFEFTYFGLKKCFDRMRSQLILIIKFSLRKT